MKVLNFLVLEIFSFRAEKNEIAYEFDDEIDLTILSNFTDESVIRETRVHQNDQCCHTYEFNEAGLQIDASQVVDLIETHWYNFDRSLSVGRFTPRSS